ncbi:MAG TPA: penicillin acylase family protein [Thermoanaerobaculia bacterium]|jgi:penicillin amidase|nr:penicillin acylase family protein [Thermoanaerobaculia bacterium]
MKNLRILLLLPLLLLFLGLAPDQPTLPARAKAALAQTSGTLRVPGLARPVTVLRDRWGVPHIYAETQDDLFFAQGFVAAQDRLWQMEIWRRTGEGRLAEVLGPEAVERDRFARLLRYRGDLDAEYQSYAPDARGIIEAFVRGVNAFIASSSDRPPIEFELAGFRPEPWTPEVCLTRMAGFGMTGNASMEVLRAKLGAALGWQLADEVIPTAPPRPLESQPRIGLEGIDDKLLALPNAAFAPLLFKPQDGGKRPQDGSNNWVVDGSLSATGKPLLANDPHRALTLPSLRSMVHLVAPGWNVIGAGEPALPGVSVGHNDRVAFGFTIAMMDQQDLYIEETNPANPHEVRFQGSWEPMRIERETIRVKGGEPVAAELKFTRHGPVIHEDRERHRAYVLRWVGSEPGTAGYLASLSLDRARDWPGFRKALERWKVPSENLVYADVDGNIGWQVAGLAPVRKGWSGLLPVPGAGEYEWQGFLPFAELPAAFNPPRHFLATANHNILPPGYARELGYDWGDPTRFLRISEILGAGGSQRGKFSVADFQRLQNDEVSPPARTLVSLLGEAKGAGPDLRPWIEKLVRWDGTLARDSAAAALYEIWTAKLVPAAFKSRLPKEWLPAVADQILAIDLLRDPKPAWFGSDPKAGRDAVLLSSLEAAVAEAKVKLGPDPKTWRWGGLHKTALQHVLATDPERKALFGLPPVERGGDGTTVDVAVGPGFDALHGASFREILDLADWDRSVAVNLPGQSGQPGSPHYGDLLPLWAEGKYFPLLYSRGKVEAESPERLVLTP